MGNRLDLRAGRGPRARRFLGGGIGGDDEGGRERRVEQRAVGRDPSLGVEQDAERLVVDGSLHVARGEARPVGDGGARPHDDGLGVGAELVGVGACLGSGDPL